MARRAKKKRPPGRPQVEKQCERHKRHHGLLLREPNVDRNQWPAGANGPKARKSAWSATTTPRVRRISRRPFHVMPTVIMEMPSGCFHYKGIEKRSCDSGPIVWFFAPLPKPRRRPCTCYRPDLLRGCRPNIQWHWTPNFYLVSAMGAGLAFLAIEIVNEWRDQRGRR
jgi:hypothetical protein